MPANQCIFTVQCKLLNLRTNKKWLVCGVRLHTTEFFFSFYYFFSLSSLSSYSLNFRLLLYYIPSIVVPLPLSILCVWRNISILTFCYITPLLHAHSQSIPEYKLTHVLLFFIFNFNFRLTFFYIFFCNIFICFWSSGEEEK